MAVDGGFLPNKGIAGIFLDTCSAELTPFNAPNEKENRFGTGTRIHGDGHCGSRIAKAVGAERALIKTSGRLLEFSLTKEGASLVKAGAMDPFKVLPQARPDERVRNRVPKDYRIFVTGLMKRSKSDARREDARTRD